MSGFGRSEVEVISGAGTLSGAGALLRARIGGRKALLVTDKASHRLFADAMTRSLTAAGYAAVPFVAPQGEMQKQSALLNALWDSMAEHALTRDDVVLALGGGAVGDLAMFAAASYMCGLNGVLAPTTLLWQLDGGLRGVYTLDVPLMGDALGLRYAPRLLLLDTEPLRLLPRERTQEGLAEAIRSAALFDGELFAQLESTSDAAWDTQLGALVERVIDGKRRALSADVPQDITRALSCGMFLASALQSAANGALTYGRALAAALCVLTRYTEAMGLSQPGVHARLSAAMSAHGLAAMPPARINRDVLRKAVSLNAGGGKPVMRAAYIADIGQYGVMEFNPQDIDSMV